MGIDLDKKPKRSGSKTGRNQEPVPSACLDVLNTSLIPSTEQYIVDSKSSRTRINGPMAIAYNIGGTNLRVLLRSALGEEQPMVSLSWDNLLKLPEFQGVDKESPEACETVINYLAKTTVDMLSRHKVDVDQIKKMGLAVAGLKGLDRQGRDVITTPNTDIPFNQYPFGTRMVERLRELLGEKSEKLVINKFLILNDAESAYEGERLIGGLRDDESGIYGVLGTGFGGYPIKELGHTLLLNETSGRIEYWPLERLEKEGCLVNGRYVSWPQGYTYAEFLVAGPWAAARFAQKLRNEDAGAPRMLATRIAQKYVAEERNVPLEEVAINDTQCLEKFTEIWSGIERLANLDWRERLSWSKEVPDDVIRASLNFLFSTTETDRYSARHLSNYFVPPAMKALYNSCAEFRDQIINELGALIGCLWSEFEERQTVVLGSGLAKAIGSMPSAIEKINYKALDEHLLRELELGRLSLTPDSMNHYPWRIDYHRHVVKFSTLVSEIRESQIFVPDSE